MTDTNWQNRLSKTVELIPAHQLLAHPDNARRHPAPQREALRGSLDTLGWAAPILVSKHSQFLLDGHARVEEALTRDENTLIPVIEVDLTEAEEKLFLASFDYITYLATYDRDQLDTLLRSVNTDNEALQTMLAGMAEAQGIVPIDGNVWDDAFNNLPDSDKAPFQQKTFTLHDNQVAIVDRAIAIAHKLGDYGSENENSNGNALTRICEAFIELHG